MGFQLSGPLKQTISLEVPLAGFCVALGARKCTSPNRAY